MESWPVAEVVCGVGDGQENELYLRDLTKPIQPYFS